MPDPLTPQPLPGVSRVLGVAAGKGGVGKSTVALGLAFALQRQGLKVGFLDADIHGPSLPRLLNINEKPDSDGKTLIPLEVHGLKVMSIGFLIPPEKAAIWRGPMMHHALRQLLWDVRWGALDVLIIDFPPGTGDVPLTLAQQILMEILIVTTAHPLALEDMARAVQMFRTLGVPLVGLIENMSSFQCPCCETDNLLWGEGEVVSQEATRHKILFLGKIPLSPKRQSCLHKPDTFFDHLAQSLSKK